MRHGLWLVVVLSTVCVCIGPYEWDQYLGDAGRTACTRYHGPDSPEILWEIALEGEVNHPFIVKDKVIVFCDTYCVFPPPVEAMPPQNIAIVDLLTGTLVQKIIPQEDFLNVYPLRENMLLAESSSKLYEIDVLSGKANYVSGIPMKASCDPRCYPIILSDRIVLPTTPVVCISLDNYRLLWNLETSLGPLYPKNGKVLNIAGSEDRVYVIIEEEEEGRRIWAVDSATGALVWTSDTLTVSEIATDRFTLFAGGDKVYALNAETGKMLWTFEAKSNSNIMVGADTVYFSDYERLYAADKESGKLKWESQWEGIPLWITFVVGTEDMVICSNVFDLSSFSLKNGTQLWNLHFQNKVEMGTISKPCPAVAEGILITRKEEKEELLALASDPELFVRQGDAFLSMGLREKAFDSYQKAITLYEKKGNSQKAEEIKKRISELVISPTPTVPPSSPASTGPTPSLPPSTSRPLKPVQESGILIASTGAVILILTVIYVKRKRKS